MWRNIPAVRGSPDLPEDLRQLVQLYRDAKARVQEAQADQVIALAALARAAIRRRVSSCGLTAMKACARAVGVSRPTLESYAVFVHWKREDLRLLFTREFSFSELRALVRQPSLEIKNALQQDGRGSRRSTLSKCSTNDPPRPRDD